jgi:endonuclease III
VYNEIVNYINFMRNNIPPEELARRKKKSAKIIAELKKRIPNAKIALKYGNNWELLVAVILSAQATDKKINEITEKLFKKYRKLDDYVKAGPKEFEQDIKSSGFYHAKAKNILASAKIIKEKFRGKVPDSMEDLLTLPGVARKTANIVLGNAYGIVEGIAVDTHVRRLSRELGLTSEMDPVKIEKDLMQILPKSEWFDFTYRLIDYGRNFCPSRKKSRSSCFLDKVK